MEEWVRLAVGETAEGRAFTDPAHTVEDRLAIREMLSGLRLTLRDASGGPDRPRPLVGAAPPRARSNRALPPLRRRVVLAYGLNRRGGGPHFASHARRPRYGAGCGRSLFGRARQSPRQSFSRS